MSLPRLARITLTGPLLLALAACGGTRSPAPATEAGVLQPATQQQDDRSLTATRDLADEQRSSKIWDLFTRSADPNITVEVNKYLWQASLDVLNFLPIETVDPFTGIIVTGYGTPPGGGRSYRATIHVSDPALDARSLKISLQTSGGASVSPETQRAIEDAVLTRARQLRIRDIGL